ncbi:Rho GTPase-activating protein 15 [Choanephora cucurbitarum]|uniref:Rho GTPase-activating protein 15 n=1 Tax=Choanephora cucurbitarum TaxID=101091 RepID=A0A1C7N4Z6_9FUNG|nr:Rho GTPase-activating protein 15 [Choanephora cucurbitarum]
MHRSTKSLSGGQDEEIISINAQQDYVNKVLKWSILDLERFIQTLKTRITVEEAYVSALVKTTKSTHTNNGTIENTGSSTNTIDIHNYFGDYATTSLQTSSQYEKTVERTIEVRREFIANVKSQVELLIKVKDSHEQRRKKVKAVLGEKNTNYIDFRTREIVKLSKAYNNKCSEYASLQQQILISSHEDNASINSSSPLMHEGHLSPQMIRSSSEEPRVSNDSIRDDNSMTSHESSMVHNKKNGMAGFITQMRSQLASAAAGDPSKQAARVARLKKEISDAAGIDQEYRQGIRVLEFLRKKQIETAIHAMRHVEAILLAKSDIVKAAMVTICKQHEDTLSNELNILNQMFDVVAKVDGKKDIERFLAEYQKLSFTKPKPIFYDNYYYGRCKEILFGSNLNEYAVEHNRTIPLLVTKCIHSVEKLGGLEKEGIYRVSGRQSNVDQLKSEFERDEESVELLESKFDVFTIAAVLKIYLRELKQPLFHLTMQERIDYSKIKEETKRTMILQNKLAELSQPQRDTLHVLVAHLAKVQDKSHINKMTLKNLSVIFTPALFHDHNQAESTGEWYADKVLEDLILKHDVLFVGAQSQVEKQEVPASAAQQAEQQLIDDSAALNVNLSAIGKRLSAVKVPLFDT